MPNLHILISTQLFSSPDSITFMTYDIFRHKKTRSVLICNSSCSILRAPISIRRKKKRQPFSNVSSCDLSKRLQLYYEWVIYDLDCLFFLINVFVSELSAFDILDRK